MVHNLSRANSEIITSLLSFFHKFFPPQKSRCVVHSIEQTKEWSKANQHVATETNRYEPKIIVIKNRRKVDNCAWWASNDWVNGTHGSSWSAFRWTNNLEAAETMKTENEMLLTQIFNSISGESSSLLACASPGWNRMETSILLLLSRVLLHVLFVFRFLTNTQLHHPSSWCRIGNCF